MNDNRRQKEDDSERESVRCFRSEPPAGDVHTARTAVTALSPSFLEDLRRGKAEEPVTSRYATLPETDVVDSQPSDDGDEEEPITEIDVARTDRRSTTRARVRELNDRISAALAAATTAPPPSLPPASLGTEVAVTGAPDSAPPLAAPSASPAPIQRRREWLDIVVVVVFLVAIVASAATIGMTIAHAFGRR